MALKYLQIRVVSLVLVLLVMGAVLACDSGREDQAAKGGCTIASQLDKLGVVLVPLTSFTKKRIVSDSWSPMDLLARPCLPDPRAAKVEIDERTEFYVFYSPPEAKAGDQVVFTWYFGHPAKLLTRPLIKVLVQRKGFDRPVAITQIWSAPHGSSKILSLGGLNSVQSKAQWEVSRIYGPRSLVVNQLDGFDPDGHPRLGKTLARVHFEIHEKGVQVY